MKKILTYKKVFLPLVAILGLFATGCENMIETPPPNEIPVADAVKTAEDLQRLLNGSYNELANTHGGFSQMLAEMLGDNLNIPNNNDLREVYNHNVLFFNSTSGGYYSMIYRMIFRANFVESKINEVSGLSEEDKNRILGEVAFIRALGHFTAVRMYAQPFGFTSDNSHPGIAIQSKVTTQPMPRESVAAAYTSILADLNLAVSKLGDDNTLNTNGPCYATKWSAKALLANVYFQMGNYTDAGALANDVIESKKFTFSDTVNLFDPAAYKEHVFSVVSTGITDKRSGGFSDNYAPGVPTCQVDRAFWASIKGNATDKRIGMLQAINAGAANEFVKSNQFNAPFFNVPILHLTQMMLIRAESYAMKNSQLSTAISDINKIITRAYTDNSKLVSTSASAAEVLAAVRAERRMELLFQGDRIHEVKRLGAIEGQNLFVHGHPWNCKGIVMQFPITEKTSIFDINPTGGCN